MSAEAPTVPAAASAHVHWLDWGPEAFDRARAEDKLILLDSGATWCHWCHVMDRVTYEDREVVELIREKFIAVRIDRDRRPEVDRHLQRVVPLIESRGNGWPLTVVLTPQGHALYKATFLPPRPDARYGAPIGLIDLLQRLDTLWRARREKIVRAGKQLRQEWHRRASAATARAGRLETRLLDEIYAGIAAQHDPRHGGFGGAPKFFSAPAVGVVLARAWAGAPNAMAALTRTLEAFANGGVYDHVGGGFHRYSVDERWHVPHFEKMTYDNAALLGLYANAAALTGRDDFARVARETRTWADRVLGGAEARGFHASQDADVGGDDDGDYFTWTAHEIRAALGPDAPAVLAYYRVDDAGDMNERRGRNVLHVTRPAAEVAKAARMTEAELLDLLERGRKRLLAARQARPTPKVDETAFADLNGMMIDAYLTTGERLGDKDATRTALRTLDCLLAELRDERGIFAHYRAGAGSKGLRNVGMLADQAWMARALLHAYTVTLDGKHLVAARTLGDYVLRELADGNGGFLDAPETPATHPASVPPSRSWEDSPSASPASVAARTLIDLAYVTGRPEYAEAGAKALASFAGAVRRQWGPFLGGYAEALDQHLHGPRSVVVVGPADAEATGALAEAARRTCLPGGMVLALDPAKPHEAELLQRLGHPAATGPVAYVCHGKACLAPAGTPAELTRRIAELAAPG